MVANSWERLADNAGGTVAGLATGTGDGRAVVFAATPVGVFRSVDAGRTWALPGLRGTVPFAEAVAVSPDFSVDRTVFACGSDGLYRSADAGEAWQRLLVGSRILGLATSFGDKGDVCVLAATETDGVLRSDDRGATWTGANAGLLDLTAMCLGLSPRFQTDRTGFVGTATGLYRTRNGARSWRVVETGLDEPAVQCLAVSPGFADDRLILAGTETQGLLRSQDGGGRWEGVDSMAGQGVTAVAFSPGYPSRPTIAAATDTGIAISRDGGKTWKTTGPGPGRVLALGFLERRDGDVLLAGLQQDGVALSTDDGATWQTVNAGLNARLLTALAVSPAFAQDHTLFVAGLESGISVSTDAGHTWAERTHGLDDPAIVGLAVSGAYAQDRTVYAVSAAGMHVSRDAALTWALAPDSPAAVRALAMDRVAILAAAAGGRLFASEDAARTWRALSAGFNGAEISSLALSPNYARDRTIFVVTTRPGTDWSGETVLWRSVDGGERWVRWLVERAGGDNLVAVVVSPDYANDELVFVGIGGRVVKPLKHARQVSAGERRPVWRGANPGADATNPGAYATNPGADAAANPGANAAANSGADAVAVTALATSPSFAEDRTLFVATNVGVFVSRDAGDTYHTWSERLDPPRTVAIAVSPAYADDRTVFALGLGGTIWRRRDRLST
jgi:photosystem II stability/assembly factor-like uncharacterized protein